MDKIQLDLLEKVAGIHEIPTGAYSLRINGQLYGKNSSENIAIEKKEDKPGIDIYIKAGTKNESLHIPVILSQAGIEELVYNDFHIGDDCDVTIVAGCGIHNSGDERSEHSGVHSFFVGKNSNVTYIEKHYGDGDGKGGRIMNPTTEAYVGENSTVTMETVQIKGVDSTYRDSHVVLADGASIIISEKVMTHGVQEAKSNFVVDMNGADCKANIISRSVARDNSRQSFVSKINGNNRCTGHTECDAIIMDNATVTATPEVSANHIDASLIHEAAIGKIAGEQLIKLMTLGLTEREAEEEIINGFLK